MGDFAMPAVPKSGGFALPRAVAKGSQQPRQQQQQQLLPKQSPLLSASNANSETVSAHTNAKSQDVLDAEGEGETCDMLGSLLRL